MEGGEEAPASVLGAACGGLRPAGAGGTLQRLLSCQVPGPRALKSEKERKHMKETPIMFIKTTKANRGRRGSLVEPVLSDHKQHSGRSCGAPRPASRIPHPPWEDQAAGTSQGLGSRSSGLQHRPPPPAL